MRSSNRADSRCHAYVLTADHGYNADRARLSRSVYWKTRARQKQVHDDVN
jgi:hypothetical protein